MPRGAWSHLSRPANRTQITSAQLQLRELIFSGEFVPGERMSELPLVQRLGVSRTPLRLALAELEHEGLLRGLPGGGYVVREFTQADVRDAVELRGVLEGTAARFAAERGAPRRDDTRAAGDQRDNRGARSLRATTSRSSGYLHLNETFHARLLKMARSSVLERSLDGIVSLPFAGPSAVRAGRGAAAGLARHLDHRSPPPRRAGRGDRTPPERPRRGDRP